jgi:RNA 3'-terminal phosphate cyclase (ATP)
MGRPGYVPQGGGILYLKVRPVRSVLRSLPLEQSGPVEKLWGIALASHLEERKVSLRMAEAAKKVLTAAGYQADIEVRYDTSALQPGAELAAFADLCGGLRLGADRAGAPGRRSEAIGRHVAQQLLEDLRSGATLDRHAADQLIPFAALAEGESRFRIPHITDHVQTSAWLAKEFLGAEVRIQENTLTISGIGFKAH